MTVFERYLERLQPDAKRQAREWVESRPPEIRALCEAHPPGSVAAIHGRTAYLMGFTEGDPPGLLFSYTDPAHDYEAAYASRFGVCGSHRIAWQRDEYES